jgi:gentisate 1,2-dioxygenase
VPVRGRGLARAEALQRAPERPGRVGQPAEHNRSERAHRGGTRYRAGVVDGPLDPDPSPLLIYRWADTDAELERQAAASDEPLLTVEYVNPNTGASVLPTLGCAAHRVRAGRRSTPVRRVGNAVYVAFRGRGSTVIDGRRFDWGPGDMYVAPSWSAVEHAADEQADLFVLTDAPVLRALGIYREETLSAPQAVTGTFTPRTLENS